MSVQHGAPEHPTTGDDARRRWEEARLKLVRLDDASRGSLDAALAHVTRIAARCLAVSRVSVWRVAAEPPGLALIAEFDAAPVGGDLLRSIPLGDLGEYARMLRERRAIAADRVATDEGTRDIAASYFEPLGIVSTIDAPIYREGEVVGVVCHEHRGAPRAWTDDEIGFAVSVAEVVALELAQDDLRALSREIAAHEAQMQLALREEAIARMARGVAHDVRNLLAVVINAARVVQRTAGDPAELAAEIEVIEEAARSASQLVSDLMEVGRAVAERGECALDDALHDVVPLLRAASEGRALAIVPDAPRCVVPIARGRLEQVMMNLVLNARDATSEGGQIEVRTRLDGAEAVLEVGDDGEGVDPALRDRLFEPYFTTRAPGARGLGLPTVRAIVEGAGGRVEVQSERGAGATFRVVLPCVSP